VIPAATVLVASPAAGSATADSPQVVERQVRTTGSVGPGFSWELLRFRGRGGALRFTSNFVKALAGFYFALLLFQFIRLAWIYRRTIQIRKNAHRRANRAPMPVHRLPRPITKMPKIPRWNTLAPA